MNLRELAIKLKSAREKAAKGSWNRQYMRGSHSDSSYCHYEFAKAPGHDAMKPWNEGGKEAYEQADMDADFIALSANHTSELCDALLECIETLEYIAYSPTRDCKEWQARETLKKLGVV